MIIFKSLRFRIAFLFSFIFVAVSVLAAGLVYFQIKKTLYASALQQATAQATAFAEQIETDPPLLPLPSQQEALSVTLVGDSTLLLFVSPQLKAFMAQSPSRFNRNPVVTVQKTIDAERTLSVTYTRTDTALADTLLNIRSLLAASILLSALFSATAAFVLAKSVLRPILAITEAATRLTLTQSPLPVAIPDSQDEVQQLALAFNHMTDRLSRAVAEQNHFFASASHELRTPLAIMQAETEVRLNDKNLPPDIRQLLENQLLESKRLQRLVEDFLMVSSLRNPELALILLPLALEELVLEVTDRFSRLLPASGKQLHLSLDPEADDFIILGDRDRLFTVISNLLDNAIKYATPHDTLQLNLHKNAKSQVVLTLSNHIEQQLMEPEKLKEAFYQTDTLKNGYGMGLWIARQILERHQATFEISQQNLLFTVTLVFNE